MLTQISKTTEHHSYQADVDKLLNILIDSLYQNKDVFMRELISNANDALDKIRFQSIKDPGVLESGSKDLEILIDVNEDYRGQGIMVQGQFRSYNRHENVSGQGLMMRKNKLVLSVFARELEFVDEMPESSKTNQIYLDGYICKEPIYRKTPLGREIADLLLAVNRPYGKSDYIPCICWGRNARFANTFKVGTRCELWGRIQSREYMKKISEEESEKRIAYEVSVSKLELMEDSSIS